MKRLLAITLAVSACAEPALTVEIRMPEAYATQVAGARVSILRPNPAAPFDCAALRDNAVDDVTLGQATLVTVERDLAEGPISVPSIAREAGQMLLIDGRTNDDLRLLKGCGAIPLVVGDDALTIDAEPVPYLTSADGSPVRGLVVIGEPSVNGVTIELRDALEAPLAGVVVSARTVGARSTPMTVTVESNAEGDAEIFPIIPEAPGPFQVFFEAPWVGPSETGVRGIATNNLDGQQRRARIPAAIDVIDVAITADGQLGMLTQGVNGLVLGVASELATLRADDPLGSWQRRVADLGDPGEAVFATQLAGDGFLLVSSEQWTRVDLAGGVRTGTYQRPAGATTPQRHLVTHGCTPRLHAIAFEGGGVGYYDDDGLRVATATAPPGYQLATTGCVKDLPERVDVFGAIDGAPWLCVGSRRCNTYTVGFGAGAYVQAAPDGGPGRLLVPQLQLESWTISQLNFRPGIRGLVIEGQSLFDTGGGRPRFMTSGDFDGDGRRDLAAWLQIPDPDSAPSLGIGLATGVFGRAAMGQECRRLRVLVADIDGNGRDDIVALGRDGCRAGSLLRVLLH